MQIFSVERDFVIDGHFISGVVPYWYALDNFLPLIGKLDIQRDPLKTKFYARLEQDIVRGCIMPQITVAFVDDGNDVGSNSKAAEQYIAENINRGFILDGIQRLNTLSRSAKHDDFDSTRPLFVTFIIAGSRDRLLYRMITLNNGQRPMSARHQIDVLADAFFDFDGVALKLVPEKGSGRVRAPDTFRKADFVKGYIAYLSESVNVDNQKIIEEKMDELIANRIIESDVATSEFEFTQVVEFINRISDNQELKEWIRIQNNFIGVCAGIRKSLSYIEITPVENIATAVRKLESAIGAINVSKVNLGRVRRDVVFRYFSRFEELSELEEFDLLDKVSGWI